MKRRRSRRSRVWRGTKAAAAEGAAGCGCELLGCVTVLVAGAATTVAGRAVVGAARRCG